MKRPGSGEIWALGAALSYAAQGLTLRAAAVDVPAELGAVLMAIPTFALIGLLIVTHPVRRSQLNPRSSHFIGFSTVGLIALGALTSYVAGNTLWVTSMALGGVTVSAPATQSVAVWSAILGLLILREPLSPKMVRGIVIFSGGITLLGLGRATVQGGAPDWLVGLMSGLGAALCWSLTNIITRSVLLRGTDRFVALGTSVAFGVLGLNAAMATGGNLAAYQAAPLHAYYFLALAGLFNIAAQISLTTALGLTQVASVSMVTSAGGVLTPLLGFLIFGDPLNAVMVLGVGLVIAGAILVQLGKLQLPSSYRGTSKAVPRT